MSRISQLNRLTKKELVLIILCSERDNKTNFMGDSRYRVENHPTMRDDRDELSSQIAKLRKELK